MENTLTYPLFKEFKNLLTQNDIDFLYKLTDFNESKYKRAEIYDRLIKKSRKDEETRFCKEYIIKDREIIQKICDIITPKINDNSSFEFREELSNMRIIEYDETDFFSKHTDFIPVNSNLFKSYSLLICLNECEEGGETKLYPTNNHQFEIKSDYTSKIKGGGLLFPKTILHEGLPIKKGMKRILFLNYNCYCRKNDYLIVQTTSKNKKFCIPVKLLGNGNESEDESNVCILKVVYDIMKNKSPDKNIFYYEEPKLTDDEFQIFYDDLFDKTLFNFDNYEKVRKQMDYLCYNMKNMEEFSIKKNYEIYNKSSIDLLSQVKLPHNHFFFKSKVYSIDNVFIVEYLYINNKLIFCNPSARYSKEKNGPKKVDESLIFHGENDAEIACEFCDKYTLECPKLYLPSPRFFSDGYNVEYDHGNYYCFECINKIYKCFKNNQYTCDILDKELNLKSDRTECIIKYNKESYDDIFNFFSRMTDENKIGVTIESKDYYSYGEFDELNELDIPDFDININKKPNELNELHKNYLKVNGKFLKRLNKKPLIFNTKKFKLFDFLKDILTDYNFTSANLDEGSYFAGKYDWRFEYNTIFRDGIVNVDKYIM